MKKRFKLFGSILLIVALALSMSTSVFAGEARNVVCPRCNAPTVNETYEKFIFFQYVPCVVVPGEQDSMYQQLRVTDNKCAADCGYSQQISSEHMYWYVPCEHSSYGAPRDSAETKAFVAAEINEAILEYLDNAQIANDTEDNSLREQAIEEITSAVADAAQENAKTESGTRRFVAGEKKEEMLLEKSEIDKKVAELNK